MNRLFRVSFDIFITSIVPILSWFTLGIILDNNLINVFSLTYPLQCLMGMIVAIFGVGANISIYKDNNKNAADNGIFYGSIISSIVYGLIIWNGDKYITFMNMDKSIYKIFGIYSMLQILLQTILQLILTKLYYKDENSKANKIAFLFNIINFVVLIGMALVTRNQLITAIVTSIIMLIVNIILLKENVEKIDFKLNLKNCLKYNSVSFSTSFLFLIIYLFGFSNAFEYSEKYILAITFATLVTDMQWDITESIKTVAKIDIVKGKFNYNEHLKNAIKLILLIILSIFIMLFVLYPIYKPDLKILSIFVGLHIIDFLITPFKNIKICYLQLEDSSLKITSNTIIAYLIRTLLSFLPTPYCTIIGQMCSSGYELICTKITYKKHEDNQTIRKNLTVQKDIVLK